MFIYISNLSYLLIFVRFHVHCVEVTKSNWKTAEILQIQWPTFTCERFHRSSAKYYSIPSVCNCPTFCITFFLHINSHTYSKNRNYIISLLVMKMHVLPYSGARMYFRLFTYIQPYCNIFVYKVPSDLWKLWKQLCALIYTPKQKWPTF